MREMKDSGYGYLGSIPIDWHVERIKNHLRFSNAKNPGNATVLSLYREHGIVPKDSREDNHNVTSEDTSNYRYVETGDFVVNKMKAWQGSMGVSSFDGIVSPAYYVYKFTSDQIEKPYLHYLLRSKCYADEFRRLSGGIRIGQWDLSRDNFESSWITIPSRDEQSKISIFIDEKCVQVDTLIANVQTQIEKLKQYKQSLITEVVTKGLDPTVPMKDSGVEWIGEIPDGWSLNRIKHICSFNPSARKALLEGDAVSYAPMDCVKNGYLIPNETTMNKVSSGLTYFENGDIVMAKVTPCFENGNIAIAHDLLNGVGFGSSELFVFRARFVIARWLMYYLQNTRFVEQCKATMTGTGGLKRVSPTFVASLTIAFPEDIEQAEIADFLDSKCTQIDRLIAIKQTKIEKLNAYKKSLIYEYVTGKREA